MDKKALHHFWTLIRPLKIRYILIICIFSTAISALALRNNNLRMVELRNEVYKADESGGDVEGALHRLRSHVYSHMNTDLATSDGIYPPIQLKYTYQRLQEAEKNKVQSDNAEIYTAAQQHCESQNPTGFSGRNRIACIEEYVSNRGISVKAIPDAMYKFNFVSPLWSPDLAGFSVLVATLAWLLLAVRILAGWLLKKATS